MADELNIVVRVNKDTGQLEMVKGELRGLGDDVSRLGEKSADSGKQIDSLMGGLTKLAASTAVLAFFKAAIQEAAAEEEAFRQLRAQMDALGLSYDLNRVKIEDWAAAMQAAAHIEDDQVVAALGRTVQRVNDLDQAMKLVQLSQDIAITSGKNFETTLEMLSRAAAGSERGLMQMRQEFGAQLEGVKTNEEALNKLAATYGGAATKAGSATLSFKDMGRSLMDAGSAMFADVLPAFQKFMDVVGGPVLIVIKSIGVAFGQVFAMIMQELASGTEGIKRLVEGVVEIVYNIFTGHLFKAKDAAVQLGNDLLTLAKEDMAKQGEIMASGDAKLKAIWSGQKEAVKQNLVEVGGIRAAQTEKELEELKKEQEDRLKIIEAGQSLELEEVAAKLEEKKLKLSEGQMLELDQVRYTADQKIAVLRAAHDAEVADIEMLARQRPAYRQEANAKIAQLDLQLQQREKAIHTQMLKDEAAYNKARQQNFESTLGFISSLSSSKNNELAAIGKAAAISQASIDTYRAANKALASAPPPFNYALMAAVIAAGLGNVAKISAYKDGGRVGSPELAMVGEGGEIESVVPDSQAKGFAMGVLAGGGNLGSPAGKSAGGITVIFEKVEVIVQGGSLNGSPEALADALVRGFNEETAPFIKLAITSDNVATKYGGRSV